MLLIDSNVSRIMEVFGLFVDLVIVLLPALGVGDDVIIVGTDAALLAMEIPPFLFTSNSSGLTALVFGYSPVQRKMPPLFFKMSKYSRLARIQGGSLSSSRIGLLLETINAFSRACDKAERASLETIASSPFADQLS
jgi:hypothetical protein